MTEDKLIEKSRNGDIKAFEQLICGYRRKILNFTYRILGNPEDAEDITQEIFVKAFRAISGFDGKSSFSTWLYTIASNAAMDELRKRKRRKTDKTVSLYGENDDGEYELPIADEGDGPYEKAKKKELQRVLSEAIDKLSEEYKTVIVLRDLQGLSYEEIAKIVCVSQGTVKSRISRGRLLLRKLLEKNRELFSP